MDPAHLSGHLVLTLGSGVACQSSLTLGPQFALIHMHAGCLAALQCSLNWVSTRLFIPIRAPLLCTEIPLFM